MILKSFFKTKSMKIIMRFFQLYWNFIVYYVYEFLQFLLKVRE